MSVFTLEPQVRLKSDLTVTVCVNAKSSESQVELEIREKADFFKVSGMT